MKRIFFLLTAILPLLANAQLRVTGLTVEHMVNPAVVDARQPRLSWINEPRDERVKGERAAVLEMRTLYSGYFRGVSNFKPKKIRLMAAQTIAECEDILRG